MGKKPTLVFLTLLAAATAVPAAAEDQEDASTIAKKTQNPGAVLVSVPFQFNFNGDIGPYQRTQMLLNVQPVFPFQFSKEYSLITRWVAPVISQPNPSSRDGTSFGVGDINPQLFVAANLESGATFGLGAALVLPTATEGSLGQSKFSVGPSMLAVYNGSELVAGALLTTASSVAGDPTRPDVGLMVLQPFVNYNLPGGQYLVTAPQLFWDWGSGQWTVPLGAGFGKVFQFDQTPVNFNVQGYCNVIAPDGGPNWQFRMAIQFVYAQPKGAHKQ